MAVPFQPKATIGLLIAVWIAIDYRHRNLTVKLALVTDLMLLKKIIFPTPQTTKPQEGLYTTNDIRWCKFKIS